MNLVKKLSDHKGISLLEVLITIGIAGVLTTSVFK
ncbi:MAG: type II secretion system protein, partial [Candidatus Zixiibacteriota bacterium]